MRTVDKLLTWFIFLFLYAPLLVMMFFSFNAGRSTAVFTGFSLKWYMELFTNRDTMQALQNTLILATLSSVIATLLGTMAAVGVFKMKSRAGRSAIMTVTNIPMMNPDIVTGVSMMLLFVFVGRLLGAANSLSFFTLLIAHITFNLPYVVLNILPKLRQTDKHLAEAAMDLGCTPVQAFFKVTLPAIRSGVLAGFLMAFTMSLDDFVISYYSRALRFQTLPLKIFAMTKKTVKPDMYALSSVIFITILILLILVNVAQAKADQQNQQVLGGISEK